MKHFYIILIKVITINKPFFGLHLTSSPTLVFSLVYPVCVIIKVYQMQLLQAYAIFVYFVPQGGNFELNFAKINKRISFILFWLHNSHPSSVK